MTKNPELIVMLTQNDRTVLNAPEIFEECRYTKVQYWGFKEEPLPPDQMKKLFSRMKEYGKTTVLEVVAYTEKEGLDAAKLAAWCGCDILIGTSFCESILAFCHENGMKYMPYIGHVTGRPSILEGSIENMAEEARGYLHSGADGINLLGYRYTGDPVSLNNTLVSMIKAPVCLAGSINSLARLDEVKTAGPEYFTIGGAFFDHRFGESFPEQVEAVYDYMQQQN